MIGRLLRLPNVAHALWGRARIATGLTDAQLIGVALVGGLVAAAASIFALDAVVHLTRERPHQA